MPNSIVARTTLLIILLAILIGGVFAGVGGWLIHRSEEQHLQAQLDELLATVESTVSIACYVKDEALAREIGAGLLRNQIVSGVRIDSEAGTLYQQSRSAVSEATPTLAISRKIHSPFKPSEAVGEIWLYVAQADIRAQTWVYTRLVVLVLGLEVALVALAVAWVVFNLITRPIRGISDELHRLEVRTGVRLQVPLGNRQDEIGRLVSDVNALISELSDLLDTEHRLRIERELSERRLALIFEKVDAGIFEIDQTGLLQSWNPAFARTLGQPPPLPSLPAMMAGQAQRVDALIASALASGSSIEADFELDADAREGASKWVELSLTPVDHQLLQGVINDITERKRAEHTAHQLAVRDALTGLLNRRGLDLGLAAAFERRQREPELGIAVLQIDLDFFKQVNDTYGHDAGDRVLQRVARVLEDTVRRTDLVARPGGDEFSLVLIGVDGVDKPEAIARQIIEAVNQPIDIGAAAQVRIGASIGITLVGPAETLPVAALRRADEAMYAAKQAGRNTLRFAAAPQA